MKSGAVFVFVASLAFVVCQYQDPLPGGVLGKQNKEFCTDAGIEANKALVNLLENGKPFKGKLSITFNQNGCETDMMERTIEDPQKTALQIDFQKTCYVIGNPADMTVLVASKTRGGPGTLPPGSEKCAQLHPFQAVLLPQLVNENTFMILKPAMAPLFFTAYLTGCDIFLATNPSKPNNPIVIHSNLNSCGKKPENLRRKGAAIESLMQSHPNYKLVARVYSAPSEEDTKEANKYLTEYKANHNGIQLVAYDTNPPKSIQNFHFIGRFKGSWRFIVKGEKNGKIIWKNF